MTVAAPAPPLPGWPAALLAPFRHAPVLAGGALLMLAVIPPTLAAMHLDDRTYLGLDIWVKPLKFEAALAIYLGILAVYAAWLPESVLHRSWFRRMCAMAVFCTVAEIIWIGGAAALGTASHFNRATPLAGTVYGLMGIIAVLLTAPSLVFAVAFARDRDSALPPAFRLSLVTGLGLTVALTLPVAGFMSSGESHLVGAAGTSDAAGLAVLGWSRTAGDLRVAHFFATHAMHVIPALGWLASRGLAPDRAILAVAAAALGYTVLVIITFAQALFGEPFLAGIG